MSLISGAASCKATDAVSDDEITQSFKPETYFKAGVAGFMMNTPDLPDIVTSFPVADWCPALDAAVDQSFREAEPSWRPIIVRAARKAVPVDQLRRDYFLHTRDGATLAGNIQRFARALEAEGVEAYLQPRVAQMLTSLRAKASISNTAPTSAERALRWKKHSSERTFLCHLVPPQMMQSAGASQ